MTTCPTCNGLQVIASSSGQITDCPTCTDVICEECQKARTAFSKGDFIKAAHMAAKALAKKVRK